MTVRQRAELEEIPAYTQGAIPEGADIHKLSSNENPYGPLSSVREAIAAQLTGINRYPDMGAHALTQRLAEVHGVSPEQIVFGAGSVEAAFQLAHASAGAGDEILFAWRSFEAYPIIARVVGATPVAVPLTADERHDLDAMADAITPRTRLVFLCTPNNPTGTVLGRDEAEAFLARVPGDVLVVIDEAYVHFQRDEGAVSGIEMFRRHPNVAVLHTFSKAYGLAGLRIGYAIAPAEVAANLRKVAVPFGVTSLAQSAALASLDAEDELARRIGEITAERERVAGQLREQGWAVPPTQANFVWLRAGERSAQIASGLAERGVLVRAFPGEGLRISIGSAEANDAALSALRAIGAES